MESITEKFSIGIDVGGSHVTAGIVGSDDTAANLKELKISGASINQDGLITAISNLIDELIVGRSENLLSIGVCCPGQSKDGILIAAANLPNLKNVNISAILKTKYNIPVVVVNDADAAICAEVDANPKLQEVKNVAMITIGTGIGVGLYLNGQLYQGHNNLIEAGHMIVDFSAEARPCGCGQKGCAEAYCSANSTVARMKEAMIASSGNKYKHMIKEDMSAKGVFFMAHSGDSNAINVIDVTIDVLAVLCINICRVIDPEAIILAGGMSLAGELFRQQVEKRIHARTWKVLSTNVKILLSSNTEHVCVIGAAIASRKTL